MEAKTLYRHIDDHSNRLAEINRNTAYAKGYNPTILRPAPKPDPDNRIPSPNALRAVNFLKGYAASPGNIRYDGKTYEEHLKPIFDENDEPLIDSQLFEMGAVYGGMYELHWVQEGKFCFEPIPFAQGIPIYDSGIRPKLIGFIWYRKTTDENGKPLDLASVFDDRAIEHWEGPPGKLALVETELHGYRQVPVNSGPFQAGWRNLFAHAIPLMDLFDKLLSQDVANEAERFNAAIMVMRKRLSSAVDEDGLSEAQKVKLWRIIDGSDDPQSEVAFVGRDIPTDFIEFAVNVVRKEIIQALQLIDPYDESFANASGAAQDRKLLPMMYLFNSIKPYFMRFLQNRVKLICGHVLADWDATETEIIMHTEMPANKLEMVQTAVQLSALTSRETALRSLPPSMVCDVDEELELIDKEKPSTGVMADDL